MFRCSAMLLFLLGLFAFPAKATAQFSLDWQKSLALSDTKEAKDITCVSQVDSFYFIGYVVSFDGKDFPGMSIFSPDESLRNITDFSVNKGLDGYRIVGFVKTARDTFSAFCNDVRPEPGNALPSQPAEMVFVLKQGKFEFVSYFPLILDDLKGASQIEITGVVQGKDQNFYLSAHAQTGNAHSVHLYKIQHNTTTAVRTLQGAINARLWWADDENLVVSSETPFATGSSKQYYEIQMLDKSLATVRKYPPTPQYLDSNATDQLVGLSYRPLYHLGMVARQVQDLKGKNRLNWYAYNGFPNGTYNKIIGDNTDLIIGASTVHPAGEKVLYSYAWPGSNKNNWIISEERNPARPHDDLVFSLETFDGLELARDSFGKASFDILDKMK